MRKSLKENIELPQINRNIKFQICKEKEFAKPKLQRIVYSPPSSPSRLLVNMTILESMISKKPYEELKDEWKQKQIEQLLRETKPNLAEKDWGFKGRVGKQAQIKYYENYKKLDKLLSKKKLQSISAFSNSVEADPTLLILETAEKESVLPCCMGFVKNNGEASTINLKGQKFGDKYIKAISAGLKETRMVQSCQFSNNRLTDDGFNQIISNISHEVIRLDFSNNRISSMDRKMLAILTDPEARLEHLNLENNLINDKAAQILCRTALLSKHLKYLNIRKNLLTKKSGEVISELVLRSTSLEELYIGVNRINEEGAVSIFESLQENRTLKVFDYCMNKLGESTPSAVKAIASVLSTNKTLVHVDLSDNNFNLEESKTIGQALEKNRKIYGFHFNGNYGYVDTKGFLKLENKDITSLHSLVHKNINSYDIVFRREAICMDPKKFTNVCWICQGWYEQNFKFVVPEPREDGKNFVYIHFDFEEFEPRLINISEVKVKYRTMVPPRRYRYFFTWNNTQYVDNFINGTSKSIGAEKNSVHNNESHHVKLEMQLTYTYEMNHENVTFVVQNVSSRTGKPKKLVNNWDQIIVSVLPRQEGLTSKKQKKAWSYKDSLWAKEWKLQDEQLTRNCFEKDWKSSKLMNLIKNPADQEKVKQVLYKHYKLIKELYRQYSSWSPFNTDIWAVSNNAFTEFCYLAKIISKDTPLTIIDLTFITTNSISGADLKGNSLVPERGLVRFQFMEGLVRLSEEKFKKNGHADSLLASVTMMMKDHIQPLQGNPLCSSQNWRLKNFFCEQIDTLLKKYRPIFTELYKKNSRIKVKPGNKPFMCLAEFKSIIERIGILGSLVLERDIFLSFNCSMMTQIDQLQNERFMRMSEIEFIEAVARCAFILPDSCRVEDIFGEKTPFHGKLEWVIHELKKICSDQIKNMFAGGGSIFNKEVEDD